MSDGCLALVSTFVFKSVDEEGSCPFVLSATPLTSSPISRAEEKLWADDFRHCNVTLLFSAVEGAALPVNTHACTLMDRSQQPARPGSRAHGLAGRRWDGVRSCLVWSGPLLLCSGLGECLAWDKAVFEEELQMLVYYRLSCHAADKASEKLLSPGRTTHRHTLTGKINVYRRHSPFDSVVQRTAGLSELCHF